MALDQSALTELLDALKAGGDLDFMRRAMEVVLQLLIELEATEKIRAGRYERTDIRTTHRNGSRARLLSTKAGDVNLQIPKLRQGSFFPSLLEPRRRIDKAMWAVVMGPTSMAYRPARSTTWSRRWGSGPGSPRAR
jgi:transposase-like protein